MTHKPHNEDDIKSVDPSEITQGEDQDNRDTNDDDLLQELVEWVQSSARVANSAMQFGDTKMRLYVIIPAIILSSLYTVAEVTGVQAILWVLLAVLFAKSIWIVWKWPVVLSAISFNRRANIVIRFLLAEFVFELTLILIGFAVPFHVLDPFILRFVAILCLIGTMAIILKDTLATKELPKNIFPFVKWVFISLMLVLVLMAISRSQNWGFFD